MGAEARFQGCIPVIWASTAEVRVMATVLNATDHRSSGARYAEVLCQSMGD